jgi:predicted ATP-dependent endonuclease of OLD family
MTLGLKRFQVEGLFGHRNLVLDLSEARDIAYLSSPNGLGKTTILRLIYEIFNLTKVPAHALAGSEFKKISIDWSGSDETLVIQKEGQDGLELTLGGAKGFFKIDKVTNSVKIDKSSDGWGSYDPGVINKLLKVWIESESVPSTSKKKLESLRLNNFEKSQKKNEMEIDKIKSLVGRQPEILNQAEAIITILQGFKISMISADRLSKMKEDLDGHQSQLRLGFEESQEAAQVLASNGRAIAVRIAQMREEYFKSQISSYRTLFGRLQERMRTSKNVEDADSIRGKLRDAKTTWENISNQLEKSGLIEADEKPVYRLDELEKLSDALDDKSDLRVLVSESLSDVEGIVDNLKRANQPFEIFRSLANKSFYEKQLFFDRETGYRLRTTTGLNARDIPLRTLSSGEMHQLVLLYDLIFETKDSKLVLIDEPEISFHPEWLAAFHENLEYLSSGRNGRGFLISTHSPIIVGEGELYFFKIENEDFNE